MSEFNELTIDNEVFHDMRNKFDGVLQRLIKSMLETKSDEGSITLKIDVDMTMQEIPNTNEELGGEFREIYVPSFEYKVSSQVAMKDESKGNNSPEKEVVYDPEKKMYVLKFVADTEQRSIFDEDFMKKPEDQCQPQTGEALGLPDNILGLPDNLIEGQAEEVDPDHNYEDMTAAELYDLCVERGIKVTKKKGKDYYIVKLRDADAEDQEKEGGER